MQNWEFFVRYGDTEYRRTVDETLKERFKEEPIGYLNWAIKFLFKDYIDLERLFSVGNITQHYNDYSFVVAPAYKAFEGFMYQIAVDLELLPKAETDTFYSSAKVFKSFRDIHRHVEDLSQRKDLSRRVHRVGFAEIVRNLTQLPSQLKQFRHSPAHYTSWYCIPNLHKAKDYGSAIIVNINGLIDLLYDAGLIDEECYQGDIENEYAPHELPL